MRIILGLILILTALIGISFAVLNAEPVHINYYLGSDTLPLSLLLVVTLGIGIAFGIILFSISYFRLKTENMRLKHKMKWIEKEVENLRTIPLKDSLI